MDNQTAEAQEHVAKLAAELAPDAPPIASNEPSPTPNGSAAGRVQFLMGGPQNTRKDRERKMKELEQYYHDNFGYDHERGRVDVTRTPPTLEVRYYHYPDDREEAEKILKSLRKKENLGPDDGHVSYVIDPDQPPHTFQIAFPREPNQAQDRTVQMRRSD